MFHKNSASMEHGEHCRNGKHQQGIQDVDIDLLLYQAAIVPLSILYHAEYRTHADKEADEIEHQDELPPWAASGLWFYSRTPWDSDVEYSSDNDKKGKKDELDAQAKQDDIVTGVKGWFGVGRCE